MKLLKNKKHIYECIEQILICMHKQEQTSQKQKILSASTASFIKQTREVNDFKDLSKSY